MELIINGFIRSLWGCHYVDWVYLSSMGASLEVFGVITMLIGFT